MTAQCTVGFHSIGICVGQPSLRSRPGLLRDCLHSNQLVVDRPWNGNLISTLPRSIGRVVPDPDGHPGAVTSLRLRSPNQHSLAQRAGRLLTNLQYGTPGCDPLFGRCLEGCAHESQRSPFRCTDWNDRLHGCRQPAVQLPMVRLCINYLAFKET